MISIASLETEIVPECPLCNGHGSHDPLFYKLLALQPPFDVLACITCGFRWLSPRPTAAAYETLYSYDTYFEGDRAVEHYPDLARERLPYFVSRVERIETLFPSIDHLRVLDVGAATGEFVHAAKSRGHIAIGLEVSKGAVDRAKQHLGVDLRQESLDTHTADVSYDVIHMNHVFEHMPDPLATVKQVFKLLQPGGLWVVEVPQQFLNDLDRLRYLLGLRRPAFNLYSLHHTVFFRPHHLERLVSKGGFEILSLRSANAARTPLIPFSVKNAFLRVFLRASDMLHRGGNILEVYARKPRESQ